VFEALCTQATGDMARVSETRDMSPELSLNIHVRHVIMSRGQVTLLFT